MSRTNQSNIDAPETRLPSWTERLRLWHAGACVLVLAVGGLLVYAFWPALVGNAEAKGPEEAVAETPASAASVEAVIARKGDFPLQAEATGHLAAWRRAEVSAETGGAVTARLVQEGAHVQKGELLFRLDDRDEKIELEEAQTAVLEARAGHASRLRSTREVLGEPDTSGIAEARKKLKEAKRAYEKGYLSKEELQAARERLRNQQVLSGQRRAEVQAATSGLAQAKQRVERAKLALQRTRVRAPFGGRVADVKAETGQRASPGQAMLTLLDTRPMKVEVDVLEEVFTRVEEGAPAVVTVPALGGQTFRGEVRMINPTLNLRQGTGRVTVAVPHSGGELTPGLFAEVELETKRLEGKLALPTDAILKRQGRRLVFVAENGHGKWRYVETGAQSLGRVVVASGVSVGDTVLVGGHQALAHDAPINVDVTVDK
jgi:HlyD family secretion protein